MTFGYVKDIFLFFSVSVLFNHVSGIQRKSSDLRPFDVIISEIMADPVPANKLPELEYIEIFNKSDHIVNLSNWTLTFGTKSVILPESLINPGEYNVIMDIQSDSIPVKYKDFTNMNIPAITNTGQIITLRTPDGAIMHSIDFTVDWYNDPGKDEGGWSIEIIDPDNPCGGKGNWHASNDNSGGTPGTQNSVNDINRDIFSPVLINAALNSDTSVILRFNEPLHTAVLDICDLYAIDNGLYHPALVAFEPGCSDLVLQYNEGFKQGMIYKVTILKDLMDCAGNHPSDNLLAFFAYAETISQTNLVINEILFESSNDLEFIEIFNRSEKIIDLSALTISLADKSNTIYKTVALTIKPWLLFPGNYTVLTGNKEQLLKRYKTIKLQSILEVDPFFALPDDEGLIVLSDTAGNTIDEFAYNKKMHHEMFSGTKEISLERIDPDLPSDDPENWQTASAISGFATPGNVNSQMQSSSSDEYIAIIPELLSPDDDGINDKIELHVKFADPGWMGTIGVYSQGGQKIKMIISNVLLGTDELLTWDGRDDRGDIVVLGIYLVYGEFYNSRGGFKKFKKVVPVVRK
jgi:hypothetical protein